MKPFTQFSRFDFPFEKLPRWSLVALGVRAALREPILLYGVPTGYFYRSRENKELFRRLHLIRIAESCAASGTVPTQKTFDDACRSVDSMDRSPRTHFPLGVQISNFSFGPVTPSDLLFSAAARPEVEIAKKEAASAICASFSAARTGLTRQAIFRDVQTLIRATRKHKWDDDTPCSHEFFATHSDFTRELSFLENGTATLVTGISASLIAYLARNPQSLYGLSSRQFEELVADLFAQQGFIVELTSATRDQGRDIIALRSLTKPVKILIECKRYHPSNTVGISIVQRLYGVTLDEQANQGILATTSYFTDDAKKFLHRHPRKLIPKDFAGLVAWLQNNDRSSIGKKL